MGFSQGEIIVDSPTGAYFAGQFVDGRLVFELQKVKKFRGIYFTVKGFCKVHWTTNHSRRVNDRTEHYTVTHESYEEYITLKLYLVGGKNTEKSLDPGKYDYPFKFQIPSTCPSSFEGSLGHVRYELYAVMDIPYAIDKEIGRNIRVLAPLDLNLINCKDPATLEFDQTYCCWCCTSGVSETVVKIPVRGYCPGQAIPVEISCNNRSTVEIDYISFNIKKDVSYRAQRQPGHRNEESTVLEMKKGPVPPHTDRRWQLEMTVPDMDVHNMDTCSYIDIKYTFNVTVSPSGCHTDDDDSCQIYFGTVPLLNFSSNGPDQIQQTNMQSQAYPPPYASFPQPAINQTVANQSYQPNSPFPPNPYPNNSPYPSHNPQPVSPYPGNAPYPNNSPYCGTNAPYPNNPSPNPPHLSPYPPNNAPYPNNPSPIPPKSSPYPNSSPYPPNDAPYPNDLSPNPPHLSPYPPNNPSPIPPKSSPYPNSSPYPPNDVPYPNDLPANPPHLSPYPPNNAPYPNSSSPIPPKSPSYPTPKNSEIQQSSSPYTTNNSSYPGSNPPYPVPGNNPPYPLEDKPGIGFGMPGHGSSSSVPLLPPGSVPYPMGPSSGRSSPYAPSAPATTPGTEQKKPFDDDHSNSPFNPAFMGSKKESTDDK